MKKLLKGQAKDKFLKIFETHSIHLNTKVNYEIKFPLNDEDEVNFINFIIID
jgi:hypothetical protein